MGAGVGVTQRLRKEWQRSEQGTLSVLFAISGGQGDAVRAATVTARDGATAATLDNPEDPVMGVHPAVRTPQGPVVFIPWCWDRAAMDTWLQVVTDQLEAGGWTGRLTTVRSEGTPYQRAREGRPFHCLAAGLVLRIDHAALEADSQHRPAYARGWYVSDGDTARVIDRAGRFCLDDPGAAFFTNGVVQFRVDADAVPDLARQAIGSPPVTMTRIGPETGTQASVRAVDLGILGQVTFEYRTPGEHWQAGVQALTDLLRDLAGVAEYGLVRPAWSHVVGWHKLVDNRQPRPPHVGGSYYQSWRRLEASHVPDAYGIQLLTDAHLANARDLSRWHIEEVASGRHLVTAPDLDSWFDHDQPSDDLLDQARHDFGAMIFSPETPVR